jgi:2,3-bisphosphoglycerate-independent phosphoglycerate mutase
MALERDSRLHLMGLIGPGGVHAIDEHIVATVDLAAAGLPADRVLLHAFTDGRDTPPRSADGYLPALLARVDGRVTPATVSGRYYAMDRDGRWERTRLAYDAIVHAVGELAPDAVSAVTSAHERDESDEFIRPTVVEGYTGIAAGDVAVHLNFRADRARQLTQALALDHFGENPEDLHVTTLTEYQGPAELPVSVAFGPLEIDSLAAHLSRLGKRQLHVAETEKYAHVTYFFNGGVEPPFPGEERILVPSNREVATYDLAPEMSALGITDALLAGIGSGDYDFVVANYANPDMVGHTGSLKAAIKAVETVDTGLGEIADAVQQAGGALLVTADHGNCEMMRDPLTGGPHTAHTTNPVPLVLAGARNRMLVKEGRLADIAPTLLELMDLPKPKEMTGVSLLRGN